MKYTLLLALLLSAHANAQCFGPAPPGADCGFNPPPAPVPGPTVLCVVDCANVIYSQVGPFTIAESTVNSYPVLGWSGPCFGDCPDVMNQAYADLLMNAKRANRAMRFEE